MTNYDRADRKAQWFADTYEGSAITPNVVVVHTTEGTDWPTYDGGATAPTYTAKPDFALKRLIWRAHFPDEMSARALDNDPGGVETNTLNCAQVELVGTCDPAKSRLWGARRHLLWPDAPDWALNDLAAFLADMHRRHSIRLTAPTLWLPYPKSYGNSPARMTGAQWRSFYGVCGHSHVPENDHGDPGNLNIVQVLAAARLLVAPPAPVKPTRVTRARALLTVVLQSTKRPRRVKRIRAALDRLPKR